MQAVVGTAMIGRDWLHSSCPSAEVAVPDMMGAVGKGTSVVECGKMALV
jgi:hypothetical protein